MRLVFKVFKTIIISCIVVGMFLILAYEQTHYVRTGHAVFDRSFSVDNYYVFFDATGYEYEFVTTDYISADDVVMVKMFNNCTEEDVTDDMVIDYKIITVSENEKEK